MVKWKPLDQCRMSDFHRQGKKSVLSQNPIECSKVEIKFETTDRLFDGHFPDACRTHMDLGFWIQNQGSGAVRQTFRVGCAPEENLGIEKEIQYLGFGVGSVP